MSDLLIFLVLPIATVILAIVLQRILGCPILVAATAFAIYLIATYTAFDSSFFIYAILYTILAFLAAYITQLIARYNSSNSSLNDSSSNCDTCRGINSDSIRSNNTNNFDSRFLDTNNLLQSNNYNPYDEISNCNCATNNFEGNSASVYRRRRR